MLRFATSPTADMNIGNLRDAIFNYIISKQKNEDFIVRIEDMDKEQNIEGKDTEILDLLALFGIEYSQVIYQSESVRFHTAMALQLLHEKKAFSCFCSDDWLQKKQTEAKENKRTYSYDDACKNLPAELVIDNMSPFTIRLSKPDEDTIVNDQIDSFIIMKQDKTPTYDFACAVDDMLNDISLIISSEDNISSSPKQAHIRTSLGYEKDIKYAHLPVIKDAPSVKVLLEEGYLPNAILNYLILSGDKDTKEIFDVKDAIECFNIEKISNSPARFDINVLRELNKNYLKNLDATELSRYVGFADSSIGELAKIYLEDISTTKELKSKIEAIFATKEIPKELIEAAEIMRDTIKIAPYFEEYDDFKNYIMKELAFENEKFVKTLRVLLTGAVDGPDIANVYKYIKNYIGEIIK